MVEISIGLGIFLSLVLSETLGVTAGGIIVPGYIALYLHEPLQVLVTFFVAILVWAIIQGMGKVAASPENRLFTETLNSHWPICLNTSPSNQIRSWPLGKAWVAL